MVPSPRSHSDVSGEGVFSPFASHQGQLLCILPSSEPVPAPRPRSLCVMGSPLGIPQEHVQGWGWEQRKRLISGLEVTRWQSREGHHTLQRSHKVICKVGRSWAGPRLVVTCVFGFFFSMYHGIKRKLLTRFVCVRTQRCNQRDTERHTL